MVAVALVLCALGMTTLAAAEEVSLKAGDTLQKVLEGKKGKRVTIRLQGGEDLTGKVRFISKDILQLGELAGKEYYDAVIDMGKISAVIVRVRE
jgi:hypothetical protein